MHMHMHGGAASHRAAAAGEPTRPGAAKVVTLASPTSPEIAGDRGRSREIAGDRGRSREIAGDHDDQPPTSSPRLLSRALHVCDAYTIEMSREIAGDRGRSKPNERCAIPCRRRRAAEERSSCAFPWARRVAAMTRGCGREQPSTPQFIMSAWRAATGYTRLSWDASTPL